jgi:thiamine phosphate synthase YjbQ (UPF0047 family)
MKVFVDEREMRTAGGLTLTDITEEVEQAVAESGVTDGLACVYTPHTTCCILWGAEIRSSCCQAVFVDQSA